MSGKLLRPILPALLTALTTHHGLVLAPAVRATLTRASAATLDRLLRPLRRRRPRQPRRLAPALAALRAQVPLRTWSEWAGVPPGALQGDLVLHCGESTAGRFCATLVAVDVATSWTELQALVDLKPGPAVEGQEPLVLEVAGTQLHVECHRPPLGLGQVADG